RVFAARQGQEVLRRVLTQGAVELLRAGVQQVPDGAQPKRVQPRRGLRPYPPESFHRQGPETPRDILEGEDDVPVRIRELRRDLRQELRRGDTDRRGQPLVG